MIHIFYLVFITIFFYSCTPKLQDAVVVTNASDSLDLTNLKKYAWLPPNVEVEELVILAVEDELNERGYELDAANPDFLVTAHVLNEITDDPGTAPNYNQFEYLGADTYTGPYQHYYYTERIRVPIAPGYGMDQVDYVSGTIIVDFIDPSKMEIIWRGSAVDKRNNTLDVLNDLPAYISLIFDKFPE